MPQREKGFRGISFKKELIDDIEKFLDLHPELGYKNVTDLVDEAVRLRVQELKKAYVSTSQKNQM